MNMNRNKLLALVDLIAIIASVVYIIADNRYIDAVCCVILMVRAIVSYINLTNRQKNQRKRLNKDSNKTSVDS